MFDLADKCDYDSVISEMYLYKIGHDLCTYDACVVDQLSACHVKFVRLDTSGDII